MESFSRFVWISLPVVLLLLAAIVVPVKLFDDNGLARIEKLQHELKVLKSANRQIRRQNNSIRNQINAFHENPEYIENVARSEMGMIAQDEVVYQF